MTDDLRRWARAGIPYTPPDERLAAKQTAEGPVPDPNQWEHYLVPPYERYKFVTSARYERVLWRLQRPYVLRKEDPPADLAALAESQVTPDDPLDEDEGDCTTGGAGAMQPVRPSGRLLGTGA